MALSEQIPSRFIEHPEWADELDDALEQVTPATTIAEIPEVARRWEIDGPRTAEWAMRRLVELKAEARAIAEQAEDWRAPIDAWERDGLARFAQRIQFFEGHLERYGVEQRIAKPKEATIRLPSGTISTRKPSAPVVSVADEEALVNFLGAWLDSEAFEAVVKKVETVRLGPLRELVTVESREAPWCSACGAGLTKEPASSDGPEAWWHDGEPETRFDHAAVPGETFAVLFKTENGDNLAVVGAVAAMPDISVTVKPG